MKTSVGDPIDKWDLVVDGGADVAQGLETSRSTSGVFLFVGPLTRSPLLQAISKSQICGSHSTPEAEIVALDCAIRTEGLPALQSQVGLIQCPMSAIIMEENMYVITLLAISRKSLHKTHGTNTPR